MPTLALAALSWFLLQPGVSQSTVAVRVKDGAVLRRSGPPVTAQHPGSTIKPFVLTALLRQARFDAGRRVACPRRLTIAGRRLDCTHGAAVPAVNGAEALAFSCNHYFAHWADLLGDGQLEKVLRAYGFRPRQAETREERRQMALGEWGVETDPDEMARAYRLLALQENEARLTPVFDGLRLAVERGTAQRAGPGFAGKTGTTSTASGLSLSAWFAGFWPSRRPEAVVVVFVPKGRGAREAAPLAGSALDKAK